MFQTIMEIMLWDFLMFYQVFLSLQMKQSATISNKQGVYKFPHKLPNDLRLSVFEWLWLVSSGASLT